MATKTRTREIEGKKRQEEEEHGAAFGVAVVHPAHRLVEPGGRRKTDLVGVPSTFERSDHEYYRDTSQTTDGSEESPSTAVEPAQEARWTSCFRGRKRKMVTISP